MGIVNIRRCFPCFISNHWRDRRQIIPKGNQKWRIQRNWQHWVHKTKTKKKTPKHNTTCVGHPYTQTNTNNVNKTFWTSVGHVKMTFSLLLEDISKTYERFECFLPGVGYYLILLPLWIPGVYDDRYLAYAIMDTLAYAIIDT